MPFHRHTLSNGLQIIGETSPSWRSVALGFWVRTGARDETPEVSGVTHFLEHMIFKGTERRSALDVNRDFDRIGSHPNAFTSEENTVFHASVLPEYLPQSVDILADILRPSIRDDDFETEKTVIINEIGMYEDQPLDLALDKARRLHFDAHNLGNSVLGTKESIRALKRDQMYDYFDRRYVAPNITAVAAGNYDWDGLVRLVEKHCGDWKGGPVGREGVGDWGGSGKFEVIRKDGVNQEHVILMSPGPSADSPLRHAADTLAVVLGDDSNSRLYWALVDPGLAETAAVSFYDNEGAGTVYTLFVCKPEQAQENLGVVTEVLHAAQRDGITEEELNQAKSKIQSHLVRRSERPMGRMRSLGAAWTYLREYRSLDDELRSFDAVTLASVREVLDRYPLDRVTTLALGPLAELHAPANGHR